GIVLLAYRSRCLHVPPVPGLHRPMRADQSGRDPQEPRQGTVRGEVIRGALAECHEKGLAEDVLHGVTTQPASDVAADRANVLLEDSGERLRLRQRPLYDLAVC